MAKVMRISEDAEKAALLHGDTVSKGILGMAYKLERAQATISVLELKTTPFSASTPLSGASFAVPEIVDGMPKAYWTRFKKELESFVDLAKREY